MSLSERTLGERKAGDRKVGDRELGDRELGDRLSIFCVRTARKKRQAGIRWESTR